MNTLLKLLLIGVNFFIKLLSPTPKQQYIKTTCGKCNRIIYLSKEYIGNDDSIACKACGNDLFFNGTLDYKDIPKNSEIRH